MKGTRSPSTTQSIASKLWADHPLEVERGQRREWRKSNEDYYVLFDYIDNNVFYHSQQSLKSKLLKMTAIATKEVSG
jgi:hypothetical protein